jgi:hypothetical protein
MQLLKTLLLLAIVSLCSFSSLAQTDPWKVLGRLSWQNEFDETLGIDIQLPKFGEDIKALEGKTIKIKGYIIPVDTEGDYQVLSAFPYANCFFCGGAGPETVMEIDLKKDSDLINKYVEVEGKLSLNADDAYRLIYNLKDVKLLSVE